MAGKHAPLELGKYLEIHEAAMRGLERERHVLHDDLKVDPVARGVLMSGRIHCAGGITIDVTKLLALVDGMGDNARVQTVKYTY